MKRLFIFLLFVLPLCVTAQYTKTIEGDPNELITTKKAINTDSNRIYTVVEQQPEFPGGVGELYMWIKNNLKYPQKALDNHSEGKVIVQFVVEKDGSVSNARVVRDGVGDDAAEETLRLVNSMPAWSPGKQNGKKVAVQYTLPFIFQIPKK